MIDLTATVRNLIESAKLRIKGQGGIKCPYCGSTQTRQTAEVEHGLNCYSRVYVCDACKLDFRSRIFKREPQSVEGEGELL